MTDPTTPGYEFTADWFSIRIPIFEKHVAPLNGSPCRLLEIGALEGRATTWLADNVLSHPDAHLDAVDLYAWPAFVRNIEKTGRARQIALHEGYSRRLLGTLPPLSYDFIYVDGSHNTVDVLEDAVMAFPLAKPGGLIAFDDYLWDVPPWNHLGTPKAAVDAFLSIYAYPARYAPLVEVIPVETEDQVWVRKLEEPRRRVDRSTALEFEINTRAELGRRIGTPA